MVRWPDNKQRSEQEKLIYDLRESLNSEGKSAYANYPDIRLQNWQYLYYGDHYERLKKIKAKYDPDNLFTYEQAVELP